MRRWRFFWILLCVLALLSLWYFGVGLKSTQGSSKQLKSRDEMLKNMDILAHPERYPYKGYLSSKFTSGPGTVKQPPNSSFEMVAENWKTVNSRFYVHSAYEDRRSRGNKVIIRIIALVHADELNGFRVRCMFRGDEKDAPIFTKDYSPFVVLHEQHNSTYLSAYIYCFIHGIHLPSQVALKEDNSTIDASWLNVQRTKPKKSKGIGLCVRPVFDSNVSLKLLAEFLGYYSGLGVGAFTFYDYEMPERMKSYLKAVADGDFTVRLVNWRLPREVANETWQYGQIAGIQDCILRSVDKEFVLLVDMDEFLVPRQHFSLAELMEDLRKRAKKKVGSYIFRQSFFCRGKKRLAVSKNEFPLVTATRICRPSKIWPAKQRSKVMLRPEAVSEGGVHFVWKHWKGWKPAKVPWQLAMIHHYNEQQCQQLNETLEEDRTAETFKVDIMFSKPLVKWTQMFSKE